MMCIIQARCGSKRLKGKIFRQIRNTRIIDMVVDRMRKSRKISDIIIATSKYKIDDDIESIVKIKNKNF